MIRSETGIKDLCILEPKVFGDTRGYFFESFNQKKFSDLGVSANFVQDNESYSSYGTLRGLHFQKGEFAQAKLIRVVKGAIKDVVVDLRKDSVTFGQTFSAELNDENKRMLFVPRGFAHGFIVLSETCTFLYKCDNFYSPEHESGIYYDDADLAIVWDIPKEKILLSEKDKKLKSFKEVVAGLSL
jgi:dTDP-4-dehydrorhamnose 3,5-epimerase